MGLLMTNDCSVLVCGSSVRMSVLLWLKIVLEGERELDDGDAFLSRVRDDASR